MIVTSQDDPLRDEVIGYADRLKACGVHVRQRMFPAECGWTSIYKDGKGPWLTSLLEDFKEFVNELRT
jgi:acetyl esterase/lipase